LGSRIEPGLTDTRPLSYKVRNGSVETFRQVRNWPKADRQLRISKAREAWPWHINVADPARVTQEAFNIDMLADAICGAYDMLGRALVLEMLPEIMAPHVRNGDPG